MNNIENDIFTLVATRLRTELGASNIYITGEYNAVPPKFPCVYLYEADNFNAGGDSCRAEVITGVMYEVQIYSNLTNGKKSECKKIAQIIDSVLSPLGFTRTMLQQIPNMQDATIFRMIARYTASVIDNTIYTR